METLYQNCWLVVRANSEHCEHYKARQKANALMIFDFMTREILEQGPVPGTVSLLWYDATGQEQLLMKVEIEQTLQ